MELLITTSLLTLVGAATVATLAGGVRVWERAVVFGTHQQHALIAIERLRRDLRNARPFAPIPFAGGYQQLFHAGTGLADPGDDGPEELGRLGYFLDERRRVLCRSFTPYRQMRRVRGTDRCHAVLEGVTRVRFSYFGRDETGGTESWSSRWESDQPPVAVKMELTVASERDEPVTYFGIAALARSPAAPPEATPDAS